MKASNLLIVTAVMPAVVFGLSNAQPGNCEPMSFIAEGQVIELYWFPGDDPNPFDGIVSVGDTFTFEYTFDPDVPDQSPGDPNRGDIDNKMLRLAVINDAKISMEPDAVCPTLLNIYIYK